MARWDIAHPAAGRGHKGRLSAFAPSRLDQVGLLDERYFMYTEEVDLCYRLAQAGWGLWYVPAAVVTHFGEASTARWSGHVRPALPQQDPVLSQVRR